MTFFIKIPNFYSRVHFLKSEKLSEKFNQKKSEKMDKKRKRGKKSGEEDLEEKDAKRAKKVNDSLNRSIPELMVENEKIEVKKLGSSGKLGRLMIVIYDKEFEEHEKTLKYIKERSTVEECNFLKVEKSSITVDNFALKVRKQVFGSEKKNVFSGDVQKLIVVYVGHGATEVGSLYPSFYNKWGNHDTFQIYQSLRKLDFQLVVFIADCCSSKNSFLSTTMIKTGEEKSSEIRMFDFQGHFYVRSSLYGFYSYYDDNGSFFTRNLMKLWDGNWYRVIKRVNECLVPVQISRGIGRIVQTNERNFTPKDFDWEK